MFESQFSRMEEALPGLRAVAVVGDDGIEVDHFVKGDLPHEVLSAEMNGVMRNLERLREELDLGKLGEVIIRTDSQNVLLLALSKEIFLLVVTAPEEATGKTRYEVQRLAAAFLEVLQ
jgi:predicted regulator of Ras-like GTPase activity (Roadblock/LC7/MglB family)